MSGPHKTIVVSFQKNQGNQERILPDELALADRTRSRKTAFQTVSNEEYRIISVAREGERQTNPEAN